MGEAFSALAGYPYLGGALLSFLLLVIPLLLVLPRNQRAAMIKVGTVNAAFSPFCALLEGHYWSPSRLGGCRLGIEDVLISFTLAAVAWGLAVWPYRHRIRVRHEFTAILRRLPGPLLYLIPFLGFNLVGLSWMASYLATVLIIGAVETLLRPAMVNLAISGACAFTLIYFIFIQVVFALWPHSLLKWNPAPPWGLLLLGVPLGEVVWSVLFGAAVPLMAGRLIDARLTQPILCRAMRKTGGNT